MEYTYTDTGYVLFNNQDRKVHILYNSKMRTIQAALIDGVFTPSQLAIFKKLRYEHGRYGRRVSDYDVDFLRRVLGMSLAEKSCSLADIRSAIKHKLTFDEVQRVLQGAVMRHEQRYAQPVAVQQEAAASLPSSYASRVAKIHKPRGTRDWLKSGCKGELYQIVWQPTYAKGGHLKAYRQRWVLTKDVVVRIRAHLIVDESDIIRLQLGYTNARRRDVVISHQSGKVIHNDRSERRADREAHQRTVAKSKAKAAYKAKPKEEREQAVKAQRDKRNPILQGGSVIPAMVGAGGALAGMAALKWLKPFKLLKGISNIKNLIIKAGDDAFSDPVSSIKRMLKNIKRAAIEHCGKVLWRVATAMVLWYFLTTNNNLPPILVGSLVLLMPWLFGKTLWPMIADHFPKDGATLQSGLSTPARLLATLFTFSVFRNKPSERTITEFTKRISVLDKCAGGWETFMTWVSSAIESLVNFIRTGFGLTRIKFIRSADQPVRDWIEKIHAMGHKARAESKIEPKDVTTLLELAREGAALREVFRGAPQVLGLITTGQSLIYTLLQPYQGAINARDNFRPEPECVLFTGAPGIGKTLMLTHFCSQVMIKAGLFGPNSTPDEVKAQLWQKGNSQYWNSYCGQYCMILDDFGQAKGDPTDPENDYMTIIRAVSSWAFPLNFADLDNKGRNFFKSLLLVGTCNHSSIEATARDFIHEPAAVARRIGHPYKLTLDPDYMDAFGRLDVEKLKSEQEACMRGTGNPFPWHIWRAQRHDFLTGRPVGEIRGLADVVDAVAATLRSKLNNHDHSERCLDESIRVLLGGSETIHAQAGGPAGLAGNGTLPTMPGLQELQVQFTNEAGELLAALDAYIQDIDKFHKLFHKDVQRLSDDRRMFFESMRGGAAVAIGSFVGIIGLSLALNMIALLVRKFFSLFFPRDRVVEPQSNVKHTRTRGASQPVLQSADPGLINAVYNNSYKLWIPEYHGASFAIGQVTFLNGTLAVQPRHFTTQMMERLKTGIVSGDTVLRFTHSTNANYSVDLTVARYLSYKRSVPANTDVEFLDITDMRAHRKIEKQFLTEKQVERFITNTQSFYDLCKIEGPNGLTAPWRLQHASVAILRRNLRFGNTHLSRYIEMRANTEVGDCGAILNVSDTARFANKCAYGIHVAGDTARGLAYAAVVTTDMIEEARRTLGTIDDAFHEDIASRGIELQSSFSLPDGFGGSFLPIGTIDKAITLCPVSKYYKTAIGYEQPLGEYAYAPAPLGKVTRDGEHVYPMINAVRPYSTSVYVYDEATVRRALHVAMRPLSSLTSVGVNKIIFSFEEAILGIPERKFRSIPRQTAAGFPYTFIVKSGKTEIFGDGDAYDLTTPLARELKDRVEHVISRARRGERSCVVFNDFLKDELRSNAKVQAVATRLISSAPLDYVIAWRMYFGDFSAAFMEHNTVTGMAPGICSYTDWHVLANRLQTKGDKVFAGDFKAFDSSEQPCIMRAVLDYINAWYSDGAENQRIREVLWQDMLHSRHLGGSGYDQRHIYQWNKSLPSGHPFTTIINSIYSLTLLVACYMRATGDLTGFWDKVYACTYGDDNVVNVADDVADVYNQVTVAKHMKELFGVTYTSDVKDGELTPYATIFDVSFLKRKFALHGVGWVCPLELDSFLFTAYWCKNKKLERQITIDVLETALEELSMHSEDVWDRHSHTLYALLRALPHLSGSYEPKAPLDRNAYLSIVLSRADNWY